MVDCGNFTNSRAKARSLVPKLFLGMALNTLKLLDIAEIDRVLEFLVSFVTICAFPIG